jgi:fibronectin type 3 domain-containing protein
LTACGKKGEPTLKAYEKPEAASGLKAIHKESKIIISWEFPKAKQQAIKGFHLLKSSGDDLKRIAFLEQDIRSYTDPDITIGQEYRYRIVSESLQGITSESMILIFTPQPLPPAPSTISFTIRHDAITLTWERPNDTSYFNIYKSTKQGKYSLTPLNPEPVNDPSFQDSFDINRIVFYTVRSVTGTPTRDEGPPSEELTVNPLEFVPSSPQELMAVPMETNVYLIWKEPSETWVTGYRIYREENQAGYVFVGSTQTPSFIDGEKATAKRNYRVTAVGPSKEGPPAEIRDVVYEPPR